MKRALLFFLLLPFLAAQTAPEVEITSEPSHHLVVDNEHVRVFKVEVAPHTSTLMHRHRHDYVFVTLGDAHLSNEVEGKSPVDLKLADGETRFTAGNFAHVASGKTLIRAGCGKGTTSVVPISPLKWFAL
jgi:quercetin dioxygenase-like cupin family protein